jgi:hypothetical protein
MGHVQLGPRLSLQGAIAHVSYYPDHSQPWICGLQAASLEPLSDRIVARPLGIGKGLVNNGQRR